MRLAIHHRTTYRFERPQARLVQLLRLTPANHAGQSVLSWSIEVDRDARLRHGRDGYGNHTTMLYVDGPLDGISIAVAGEVLTDDRAGVLGGLVETLPPAAFFQPTTLTAADGGVRAFVAGLALPDDPLGRAHGLMEEVHRRLERAAPSTGTDQRAAVRLEEGWGDPQGFAHLLIAAARQAGLPARYVAGHLYRPGAEAGHAAHGWAELHVAGHGWIGFDAYVGACPTETHVRVAIGLDHAQAAPLAGARLGPGDETLAVDVRVERRGAAGQG